MNTRHLQHGIFHHFHIQKEHHLQTKQVFHKEWIISSLPGIIGTTSPCYVEFLVDKATAGPKGNLFKGLVHTVGSPGKCILYVWFVKAVANAHNSANWECNYSIYA